MHVYQVELVFARRVVQRDRKRKRIRRVLEERIILHLDLMKEDPFTERI